MALSVKKFPSLPKKDVGSQAVLKEAAANELFFAVVGPVGAGCSRAAEALKLSLESAKIGAKPIVCTIIKASDTIRAWAEANDLQVPSGKTIEAVDILQDYGDRMRETAPDSVALAALKEIAKARAALQKQAYTVGSPVLPDGTPKAFIIDSIKHPAEAKLLRELYGNAFALVGVVCEETTRESRLLGAFFTTREMIKQKNKDAVRAFMKRDSDDIEHAFGQHVTNVFHEADFFVDNTADDKSNEVQYLNEPFGRLIDAMMHSRILRPTVEETAMHVAYSAKLRSACLSRQVGAALVDRSGNIIATGTNEVPKAGGGVYGQNSASSHDDAHDDRCAFRETVYCSNNQEQNRIIEELVEEYPALNKANKIETLKALRKTSIGSILEFSRAVHAEMDAILAAARTGASLVGTRLFVTTFPCHYCARHIVSAGVFEVQYIEPYPKSRALALHSDSITTDPHKWVPPSSETIGKVLFAPFVGIAPRLYARIFVKDRAYKDSTTGDFLLGDAKSQNPWHLHRTSYSELEARPSPA